MSFVDLLTHAYIVDLCMLFTMLLQEILAAGTNIVEAATNLAHATSACKNQSAPVCATDIDKASDKHGSHFPTPPLRPNITCYKNKELSMNIIVGKRLLN